MKKLLTTLIVAVSLLSTQVRAEHFPPPKSPEECVSEWVFGARYTHCVVPDWKNCEIGEECPVLWEKYCRCDIGAYEAVIKEDGSKGYLLIEPEDPSKPKLELEGI